MRLEAIKRAVTDWLNSCCPAVWCEDEAPVGARFPCLQYRIMWAPMGEKGSVTVTCWARDDHSAATGLAERVMASVPQQGRLLRYPGGVLLLSPGKAEQTTSEDRAVRGVRLVFAACWYERPGEEAGSC